MSAIWTMRLLVAVMACVMSAGAKFRPHDGQQRSRSARPRWFQRQQRHVENGNHAILNQSLSIKAHCNPMVFTTRVDALSPALTACGGASAPEAPTTTEGTAPDASTRQFIHSTADMVRNGIETSVAVATPLILTLCGIRHATSKHLMSMGSIYVWSLIGSSVGFYLFLYFISVGYGLGIGLPVWVTGLAYLRYCRPLSLATMIHGSLVILWSFRLVVFLLYREHCNWPALHAKIVRVNQEQRVGKLQKLACWIVYSFLYVCMLSPCWLRMEESLLSSSSTVRSLKLGSRLGIGLQIVGLVVETIADCQKSSFKRKHRLAWCRKGLWKYSTNPNYAGEWLFWLGTYIAGGTSRTVAERFLQISGLAFISIVLFGATRALSAKQAVKYGADYQDFQSTHTVFGPKVISRNRRRKTAMSEGLVGYTSSSETARPDGEMNDTANAPAMAQSS